MKIEESKSKNVKLFVSALKRKRRGIIMRSADKVVEVLIEQGTEVVFGVPGDTSMSFHNAFKKYEDEIKYISCRDERHSAYMADTYARVSGKPGVVDVPSGGGLLYAIPGLSEATSSSIPIVCLSSDIALSSQETGALTELKQEEVSNAVTKWNATIKKTSTIPLIIRKAFRMAMGGRPGAVHVSIPEDIHEAEYDSKEDYSAPKAKRFVNAPTKSDILEVKNILQKSKRPVVLAGGGVHLSKAYEELTLFSESLGIPVATSINGKGSISESSLQSLGVIGVNGGSEETNTILKQADAVLVLGSKLNNVTTVAKEIFKNNPNIVQVDISEEILQLNTNPKVSVSCDIKAFLESLYEEMKEISLSFKENLINWNEAVQEQLKLKFENVDNEVNKNTTHVNPAKVIDVLDKTADGNSLFVVDAGTQNPYMAANYTTKKAGRTVVFDRGHGNLGYALSASIGAKYANPKSKVYSLFGDGSFAMSAGELETAKRLNLPIVFMLFQNNSYGWIKKLHQLYYSEQYIGVDFTSIDGAKVAEGFGLKSRRVTNNKELEDAILWANQQEEPVFIDLIIEPITDIVPPVTNWKKDSEKAPEDRKALTY